MAMRILTTLAIALAAICSPNALGDVPTTATVAAGMASAANKLLDALSADRRARMSIAFDDPERENWDYMPHLRKGVPRKELSESQWLLVDDLIKAGLSDSGFRKANSIITILEPILREQEKSDTRDPGAYYVTIFGSPGPTGSWGWRVEGHHLTLNFTIVDGQVTSDLPMFMGANPRTVLSGPHKGLRNLEDEEEIAWKLVRLLSEEQRKLGILSSTAPGEITIGPRRQIQNLPATGIPASKLNADQQKLLKDLIAAYANRLRPELAEREIKRIDDGFDKICFAWMGGLDATDLHFYRIDGPDVLIELDNTQGHATHIHTIWHDPTNDFGFAFDNDFQPKK